ncbi:hypothetical protein Pmani_010304 [Petrolisthes manimaculis]|uniref:Cytochrome P450 n=1 Tax=Petrolisthes manimaculis TaxID=1843537 RepID=A0AAE1Q268_9EUCA|nr:hypothetical protein Pmani_010304 [Petrolisthes manimaculis]
MDGGMGMICLMMAVMWVILWAAMVGILLMVTDVSHRGLIKWRMGTQLMVFLHDHNLVREAFNRPEIQDRPDWHSFRFNLEEKLGGCRYVLEAVIHESLRVSSLSCTGVSHAASRDTMLGGYVIPKGAILNSSNIIIHHSSRYWDEPHLFKPERWLDNNGKFNTKKEGFMPFSIGKRQCVGEGLARMEMLIFTSALMQNFTFTIPPGATLCLESVPGNPFFRRHIIQNLMAAASLQSEKQKKSDKYDKVKYTTLKPNKSLPCTNPTPTSSGERRDSSSSVESGRLTIDEETTMDVSGRKNRERSPGSHSPGGGRHKKTKRSGRPRNS